MKVWLIWMMSEGHIWLEAAWDDEMTAENTDGWRKEVDRCRELSWENGYEMRLQAVDVPGVSDLFKISSVVGIDLTRRAGEERPA